MSHTNAVLDRRTVLPGGGVVDEFWCTPSRVHLRFVGEFDAHDEFALVDLLTGLVLEGALDVTIDAGRIAFCGLGPLHVFNRARRRLAATGGVLCLADASAPLARIWALISGAAPLDGAGIDMRREDPSRLVATTT